MKKEYLALLFYYIFYFLIQQPFQPYSDFVTAGIVVVATEVVTVVFVTMVATFKVVVNGAVFFVTVGVIVVFAV